jgi:hypothetical protein
MILPSRGCSYAIFDASLLRQDSASIGDIRPNMFIGLIIADNDAIPGGLLVTLHIRFVHIL